MNFIDNSNLTLDEFLPEILCQQVWPHVIKNGSGPAAAQVCAVFARTDAESLWIESDKILKHSAKDDSILSRSIQKLHELPRETREDLYRFNQQLVSRIQSLGGPTIAVPQRPLTAEEVQEKSAAVQEVQDRALEKIWPKIVNAVLTMNPNLALDLNWKAAEIQSWMEGHRMQLQEVQELSLRDLQLTVLPEEIILFPNLTALDLSNNQLPELPAVIFQLTNLETLDVQDNPVSELPFELCGLTQLQDLRLSNHQYIQGANALKLGKTLMGIAMIAFCCYLVSRWWGMYSEVQ